MRLLIAHRSREIQKALAEAVNHDRDDVLEVLTAVDGAGALDQLLHDAPPEVAFVDWDLPDVEGPELCRLVRDFHHGRDTWMIVLMDRGNGNCAEAWQAGADDCVETRAAPSDLRACVDRGLATVLQQS